MTEISTLTTDYLLGLLAALFGFRLLNQAGTLPVRLWGWALIAFSLAAFAGGTWHGFQFLLGENALFWIWKADVYLVGVFGVTAASGSIIAVSSERPRLVLLATIIAITVVYAVIMTSHDDFNYVITFSAAALLLLLAVHAIGFFRARDPASPWIIAGILVSLTGAAIQASGLSPHQHFNNNDLFHVVQMVGTWLFFRGAQRLGAPPQNRATGD